MCYMAGVSRTNSLNLFHAFAFRYYPFYLIGLGITYLAYRISYYFLNDVARNEAMAYLSAEGEAKGSIISTTANGLKQSVGHSLVEEPLMHRDELREMKFEHEIVLTIGEKPIKAKYLAAFKYFHYKDENGQWARGIKETRLDEIPLKRMERPFDLDHVLGLANPHFWKL